MASYAVEATSASPRVDRYRTAERALWSHYGLEPREHFVEVGSPRTRLRVLDVGSGPAILFVHGTVGPGGWPSLVRELAGFRCLVLDRPGWGLSLPIDFSKHEYKTVAADISRDVLDALDVEEASLIGGSVGNVWALGLAARHPSRVTKAVLLGGSPLVPEVRVPGFIRALASPVGVLMVRLANKPARVRSILRHNGHGPSLDDGRIPEAFIDWRVAVGRDTASMRNERDMVRTVVARNAFRPGLTFADAELSAIETPTLLVFGTADPVGSVEIWTRAAGILPRGELRVVEGGGHMPWFDDAKGVASEIRSFLEEDASDLDTI
jgi:pimeloyl-ACP methyl ester carboxylesterase